MRAATRHRLYLQSLRIRAFQLRLIEGMQRPAKLPKATPASAILKCGRAYVQVEYTRYQDLSIPCPCGDTLLPIPGAKCVSCRAEVVRIVDAQVLRETAEQ